MSSPHPHPVTLFYSYSHRDAELRDELNTHLALLKNQGLIADWHDRKILPGEEFDRRISEELDKATIILLLVSADFLASSYCTEKELNRAMERHESGEARVIPVILRPCDWHAAPFGKLQAVPKDGKPVTQWRSHDEAFADVAAGIRKVIGQGRDVVELTEDEQRKLLVAAAVQVLGDSNDSLQALAVQIGVLELREGVTAAREIVDKLLGIHSPPKILAAMLRAIDDLDRRQSKTAADVIEQAAYFVIPAALTDAHIKQLRPGRKITSAFCAAW